jgi:hypothetical protein
MCRSALKIGKSALLRGLKEYEQEGLAEATADQRNKVAALRHDLKEDTLWSALSAIKTVMKPLLKLHGMLTEVSACVV